MKITRLTVQSFRNLMPDSIQPHACMNLIYGENAQGKTNLLEAMWLFTGGHSFRGVKDADLIQFGADACTLELEFFAQERDQTASLTLANGKRTASINGIPQRSAVSLVGTFCAVLFSPEHLSFVKGGPGQRRAFLDTALCQSRPAYAKQFALYQRTLQQRNSLLKDIPRHPELLDTLEIWDQKLSAYGSYLVQQRQQYLSLIAQPVREMYAGISRGKEELSLSYVSSVRHDPDTPFGQADFYEALHSARQSDLAFGYTAIGPHRDDLDLRVDQISARLFGSQGQQRSIVLAVKLAEAEALQRLTGEPPVIFLDDVLSELDAGRQDFLLNHLKGRQVFLTCCDPNQVRGFQNGALLRVEQGSISQGMAQTPPNSPQEGTPCTCILDRTRSSIPRI